MMTNKLTNWHKEPSIYEFKKDFENAKSSQSSHINKLSQWEELYNAPKFGSNKHKGSRVVPKLVRKQAEWNAPSLSEPFLSTSNLFDVKPLTFDDVARAKQNALILNNQFNTVLKKTKLVDGVIRQLVKYGTCIVRTGWEYQEKEVVEQVEQFAYTPVVPSQVNEQMAMMAQQMGQELPPDESQLLSQEYQRLEQLKQTHPDSYENEPSELKAGFEMSTQKQQLLKAKSLGFVNKKISKVVKNNPIAKICEIKNVYIDPTCRNDFEQAQFVIHSWQMSLAELKQSGQYVNLDKITIENTGYAQSGFVFNDTARKKLTVYEYWGYWDIHGNGQTTAIVATWVGDVLIRLEENPFPDGKLPFVVFNFIPQEDTVYGIPNAELLQDNQEILGAVMRGVIDLMGKSANSQTGFAKNFLDATNKVKFTRGMDYEFNPNMHPANNVFTHKYPEIPNSAMNIIAMMNNDAESLSGVKAFSGTGISASNLGDVAVGVRGVLDAVSKREMSILRRVSDGFVALGRKIMAMNSEFLSEQEVVRVTNEQFVTIKRDDLAGNFDLVLTISTAEGDDAKAKELAFMLQTMGNTMGQPIVQMLLSEIASLRKMPELAQAIKDYAPEPDPIQQKMQELELAKLEAQIAMMKAEAMESEAKAQVQQAKVGVEHARAENLQSEADNKTLDFVQKDTGIKHTQELEKQHLVNQAKSDTLQQQQVGDLVNNLIATENATNPQYPSQGFNL